MIPRMFILLCAIGFAFVGFPTAFAAVDHSAFDAILKANVRNELVDYNTIRAKHQQELNGYLDAMAQVDPASLSREEQLAYYINLYNATMIREVINRYSPGWTPAAQDFKVFKDPAVRLKSGTVSLDHLEHQIIRPTFKDPRIHVALVCAARSCPPLLPRAYTGETLDATLQENMTRFVTDPTRNPIDVRRKELRLSKLLEWYSADFGGAQNVSAYVDKYHPARTTGWKTTFVDYVWDLNITQ